MLKIQRVNSLDFHVAYNGKAGGNYEDKEKHCFCCYDTGIGF